MVFWCKYFIRFPMFSWGMLRYVCKLCHWVLVDGFVDSCSDDYEGVDFPLSLMILTCQTLPTQTSQFHTYLNICISKQLTLQKISM